MFPAFLIITGICAAFAQAFFFRDLLAVFQGNDLAAGILTAASAFAFSSGAFICAKFKRINSSLKTVRFFPAVAALLFVLSFVFIMNIRNILNISPGAGISLKSAFIYIFASVFPFFFVFGAGFLSAVKINKKNFPANKAFIFILSGIAAGGLLFFCFMYAFAAADIVLIASALLFTASVLVCETKKSAKIFFAAGLAPVCCAFFFDAEKIDIKILEKSFGNATITDYAYTPYGQTVMSRKNNEYSLFVNNILLFSYPDGDILKSEDFGHIPMLHLEYPENILVIGGAAKYLPMILEHKVKRVDYLEPDKPIVEMVKKNISHMGYAFNDERVRIHNGPARAFLKKSDIKYNLILVGQPAPVNLKLNGFYTKEFFREAKANMKKRGFIAVKLPGTMAFSTYIMAELNKSVMEAMKSVFLNVSIIPGSQNILIASDRKMPYRFHIKKRLYKMQETTLVLSKYYLDDRMDTERVRWLENELDKVGDDEALINTDTDPKAMLLSVLHSQSAFSPYLSLILDGARHYSYIILFAVVAAFFFSKSLYAATAFVSGSASVWVFITALFAVQMLQGDIFRTSGLLTALFALGISSGKLYSRQKKDIMPLNKKMFRIELLFLMLIILLLSVFRFYSINIYIICVFLTLAGFAAGTGFARITEISELFEEKRSGKLKIYRAAAAGILFASLAGGCFLIAAWGIEKSLLFILFMKFLIFCRWADIRKRGL